MILHWIKQWREVRRKQAALIYIVERLQESDRRISQTFVDLHKVAYDVILESMDDAKADKD